MRSSGGVYQPTTTSINGPDKSWSTPRFLGPGGSATGSRSWPKNMVLLLAALFAIMGLVMVIVGASWYRALSPPPAAPTKSDDPPTDTTPPLPPSQTPYITVLVVGLLLMIVAIVGLIAYYRSLGLGMPCCPGKIAHIRQRFNSQNKYPSGAPICAQYCPPSTTSPSPPVSISPSSPSSTFTTTQQPGSGGDDRSAEPPFADVSEQQRLMGDECERMLEEDPRIVLSPLKSHEEC